MIGKKKSFADFLWILLMEYKVKSVGSTISFLYYLRFISFSQHGYTLFLLSDSHQHCFLLFNMWFISSSGTFETLYFILNTVHMYAVKQNAIKFKTTIRQTRMNIFILSISYLYFLITFVLNLSSNYDQLEKVTHRKNHLLGTKLL